MSANAWSGLHRKFVTTKVVRGTREGRPSPVDIAISDGSLLVGGERIADPNIGRAGVTWSQKTSERFTSGSLQLLYGGLMFRGSIWEGADEKTAVRHLVQGISAEAIRYTTRAGTEKAPAAPTTDGVEIALELVADTMGQPLFHLYFHHGSSDEDLTTPGRVVIEPVESTLHVKFHFPEQYARAGHRKYGDAFPMAADFLIDFTGTKFDGTMHRYDAAAKEGQSADAFTWTGEAVAESAGVAAVSALSTETPGDLSLAELTSLAPRRVGKYAYDLIVENMNWAIDDDWRTDFIKLQKPSLDAARQALIQPAKDFYTQTLGPAYLGWMLKDVNDATVLHRPFSEAEKRRLAYFWSDGLGKNAKMNQQMLAMGPEAALRAEPRLLGYVDDKQKDWALEAFKDFTDKDRFAQTLNAIEDGSVDEVQRQTELLHVLAPTKDYHVQFQRKLVTGMLARLTTQADASATDQYTHWFEEAIKALLEKRTQADPELRKILDELNVMVTDVAGSAGAAKLFIDAFVQAQGEDLFERAGYAQKRFAHDHPGWAGAGKLMLLIAWTAMALAVVIGFMNWGKLPPDKQAGVVIGLAAVIIDAANEIHALVSGEDLELEEMVEAQNALDLSNDAMEFSFRIASPSFIEDLTMTLNSDLDDSMSAIGKLFTTARLLRGLTVLAATAFAVWTSYEFFSQVFSSGTLTSTILNKVSLALNMLSAWSIVPTLIFDIPGLNIIAAALVFIGVIFSIITQILNSIETPADDLMDHVLRPFVSTLPDPPADWQPKSAPA